MRSPLEPDVGLDVLLSAICARNQYTRDPAPVIDELTAAAGGRDDILARAVGVWAGYYERDATPELVAALLALDGAARWVGLGRRRKGAAPHGAPMNRPE